MTQLGRELTAVSICSSRPGSAHVAIDLACLASSSLLLNCSLSSRTCVSNIVFALAAFATDSSASAWIVFRSALFVSLSLDVVAVTHACVSTSLTKAACVER